MPRGVEIRQRRRLDCPALLYLDDSLAKRDVFSGEQILRQLVDTLIRLFKFLFFDT